MTEHDLNDELNRQHELASAYLDGVASPAERAQVEASFELRAIVASFTVVRAQIADAPTSAQSTREAALAAAFAELDAPAVAPATAEAAIVALDARRRWAGPVLSIAAAVLLIGAIGVAAKGGLSGNDSQSSSMDTSAKAAPADAATESRMSTDTMVAMASASTIGAIPGGAQAALIVDTPEQLQELTSQLPGPTLAASDNTADAATPPAPTDLAGTSYARAALTCLSAQQEFLADILYQGIFAIAARDTVTGMISAVSDDCTVLATVGP